MSIRSIIAASISAIGVFCVSYVYISNHSMKISTIKKHLPPIYYKFPTGPQNIHHNISSSHSQISNTNKMNRTPLTAFQQDWIKEMEEKYHKDNERIRKICNDHRATLSFEFNNNDKINEENAMRNMVVDVKHKLAYCRNAKVNCLFLERAPRCYITL